MGSPNPFYDLCIQDFVLAPDMRGSVEAALIELLEMSTFSLVPPVFLSFRIDDVSKVRIYVFVCCLF